MVILVPPLDGPSNGLIVSKEVRDSATVGGTTYVVPEEVFYVRHGIGDQA